MVKKSIYVVLLKVSAQLFCQSRKTRLSFQVQMHQFEFRGKITVNSNKDSHKCAEHGKTGSRVTAEASYLTIYFATAYSSNMVAVKFNKVG